MSARRTDSEFLKSTVPMEFFLSRSRGVVGDRESSPSATPSLPSSGSTTQNSLVPRCDESPLKRFHVCPGNTQAMADPSPVDHPPSPRADPADTLACGLDRLMLDIDSKPATNGVADVGGKPTLQPQAASAAAAVMAGTTVQMAPSQGVPGPTTTQGASVLPSGEPGVGLASQTSSKPCELESRSNLVVPTPQSAPEETRAASPDLPALTLSSSKSPPLRRKTGPRKLGAKKLGAMKLGSGGAVVKLSGFDDAPPAAATPVAVATGVDADLALARKLQDEEDAAAGMAAAPSSRLAAAATAALATQPSAFSSNKKSGVGAAAGGSIYRSANDSSSSGGGIYGGYKSGGSGNNSTTGFMPAYSSAGSGGSGYGGGYGGGAGSFDKDKYKNVKGIGSDMLFGARDDDPEEQSRRVMKGQEFSQSSAISSDMYFDREVENGKRAGGGGGMGDMADQIATDLQGVGQAATKLKVSETSVLSVERRVV